MDSVKYLDNSTKLKSVTEDDEFGEVEVDSKLELKKELGVVYGVAVITGLVIGGGIYISPQVVLRHAGSPGLTLVMWLFGGVFAFVGALCFAEIGVKFPRSGAFYAYLTEFYGPYFGFMYLWQYTLLIRCGSNALKTTLLANIFLKIFFTSCPIPSIAVKCVASFFAVGICVLSCLSVKLVARGQTLMTMISMGTLLAISCVGFHHIASGEDEHLKNPFENSSTDIGSIVLALYNTVLPLSGWAALNFVIEEVNNPKRTLPASITITMALIITLYTLVNLTCLTVLSPSEMLASEAVAISMALKVWTPLAWVLSICIAITSSASFVSGILVGSRLTFAGARNGHVPKVFSYINVTRYTPTISIILQAILCLCYIWFVKIDFIIQSITFSNLSLELIVIVAFIRIRLKKARSKDPKLLELPLAMHISYALASLILCVVPLVTRPLETCLFSGVILFSTFLLYVVFIKWKPPFLTNNQSIETLYRWLQILFNSAPPDKKL